MPHDAALSSLDHTSGDFAFSACLPFSKRLDSSSLASCGRKLIDVLGLSTTVKIIEGNGEAGLNRERRFRLKWWTSGEEPVRRALHQSKTQVYRQAKSMQQWQGLTAAWKRAEDEMGSSSRWRQHLLDITRGLSPADDAYLRLAYRAGQQAWSRAARWQATMPTSAPSPFAPLVELFGAGAWPLGCHEGCLWIFVWNDAAPTTPDFGPAATLTSSDNPGDYVFLSARFRDSASTALWESAFHDRGWKTVHGPISEDVSPPEPQLGKRIRDARAVVGLIHENDPDFGLPWWMYQELDYASACKRPVLLISQSDTTYVGLPDVQTIRRPPQDELNPGSENEIWRWLSYNAAFC
jgi:hypothetical protein